MSCASDIVAPHRSAYEMARSLATYMDCPHSIYSRVKEDFQTPPSILTIRDMRRRHLARKNRDTGPIDIRENRAGYIDKMERANVEFLAALQREGFA